MSKYTTGELAKMCEVSVRTVQFYDSKDLLNPSKLTDGGRRLYSDDDLNKMRLICLLKSLGLALDSIKGILDSNISGKVILLLFDEQAKQLGEEIKERQNQRKTIELIRENICNMETIPVNSIIDLEHMMNKRKKSRKTRAAMLAVGIAMTAIQVCALLLGLLRGLWVSFAVAIPIVILMGIMMTRMYYKNTAYICAECNEKFQPTFFDFTFSKHTPKARKLKCPKCGVTEYCIETSSDKGEGLNK